MVGSSGRCAKTFPANQEAEGNSLDSSPAWGAVMKKVTSLQGRRTLRMGRPLAPVRPSLDSRFTRWSRQSHLSLQLVTAALAL